MKGNKIMMNAWVITLVLLNLCHISWSFTTPVPFTRSQSTLTRTVDKDNEASSFTFAPSSKTSPWLSTTSLRARVQADGAIVIGGGLSGLATAAALRNIGGVQNVRLIEALEPEEFVRENKGAAVQLGPNGLRALRKIGGEELVARIIDSGARLVGHAIILPTPKNEDGSSNVQSEDDIQVMVMPDDGGLQVIIRRSTLLRHLIDIQASQSITTGKGGDIIGYRRMLLDGENADGEHHTSFVVEPITITGEPVIPADGNPVAPLIVGADGIYSTFRPLIAQGATALHEGDIRVKGRDVKDDGYTYVKAVVPRPLPPNFKPGHTYSFFTAGGTLSAFAGPAGEGYTYWAISIADVPSEDGGATKFLANVDLSDLYAVKTLVLDVLRTYDRPECQFVLDLIEATDPNDLHLQRSCEAASIGPRLFSEDCKVAVVGDAAHAMSPSYGQSENFAFEDAAVLGVCIRDANDLGHALKAYSAIRVDRCLELQIRSSQKAARAMAGENTEDVSKWISNWNIE